MILASKCDFYKTQFQLLTQASSSHTSSTDYLYAKRLFLPSPNLSRLRDLKDCQTDYSFNSYMCAFITCTHHVDLKFIRLLACLGIIRKWEKKKHMIKISSVHMEGIP